MGKERTDPKEGKESFTEICTVKDKLFSKRRIKREASSSPEKLYRSVLSKVSDSFYTGFTMLCPVLTDLTFVRRLWSSLGSVEPGDPVPEAWLPQLEPAHPGKDAAAGAAASQDTASPLVLITLLSSHPS
jgi:hypothetical protein